MTLRKNVYSKKNEPKKHESKRNPIEAKLIDVDVLAVVIDADHEAEIVAREVETVDREAETRGGVAKEIEENDL